MIPMLAAAGAATAEVGAAAAKAAAVTAKTAAETGAVAAKTGAQAVATMAQTATGAEKAVATSGVNAANTTQTLAPQAIQGGNAASLEQAVMDLKTGKVLPDEMLKMAETESVSPFAEKTGGTYGELKNEWGGKLEAEPPREVHHMPANDVNGLKENDGPAIVMEKADHRQTASCGSSLDAREYRQQQKVLIDEGKFEEAMQMDIDDIHDKFGNKYDDAIAQMKETAKEKGLI